MKPCSLILLLAVTVGCQPPPEDRSRLWMQPAPAVPREYRSSDGQFSVTYPSDWQVANPQGSIVKFTPNYLSDGAISFVLFGREPADSKPVPITPELERVALLQAQLITGPFSLIEARDVTLGGQKARQWHFLVNQKGTEIWVLHLFAHVGNEVWTAYYAGTQSEFKQHQPTVEQLIRSARFTPK